MFGLIKQLILERKEPDGTFVGVNLSKKSKDKIYDVIEGLKIPNPIDKDKLHVTLIYSRKYLPNFEANGKFSPPIIAKPKKLEKFTNSDGKDIVLVIRLDSPDLIKRNKEITKEHGATSNYDSYKPHVTLSYNCETFDPASVDIQNLIPEIEITDEYTQNLDLNWAKKINDRT